MGGESFFAHLSMRGFRNNLLTFCCSIVNLWPIVVIKSKETNLQTIKITFYYEKNEY